MIQILLMLLSLVGGEAVETVQISRYDMGPTVATLEARLEMGHITPEQVKAADSFIAVQDCGRIGEVVQFRLVGKTEWLNGLVYDCATRNNEFDQQFMEHIEFELDWFTAQRWGYDCLCAWEVEVKR